MNNNRSWSNYGRHVHLLKRIRSIGIVFFAILLAGVSIFIISQVGSNIRKQRQDLKHMWDNNDYERVYDITKELLKEYPVDYFLLTINGFAAFKMGDSQIDSQNELKYINESIFSLRKAIIQKDAKKDKNLGYIYYVLGKAYSHKGVEYADLAVKYLEMADRLSCDASDIPEYLGPAYADLHDYRSSVAAFAKLISPGKQPSDKLLIAIARSYMAMEEFNTAQGYLQRCIETSPDSMSVIISRIMLAEIYMYFNDLDSAEKQYLTILNDSGENAQVRYQLGELYSQKGDTTRARSEWRMAYRQDPSHAGARERLNI